MSKNPSLSDVVHQAAQEPDHAAPDPAGQEPEARSKTVILRVTPTLHRELRLLALNEDTTVQALGVEALNALVATRE